MTDKESEKGRYHHGDLRQAILEAACRHLRQENADTLSLRALARGIGVSQTAPYRHFDSRNALFAAIATWGFQILEAELRLVLQRECSTVEHMIDLGLAYLQFAEAHQEKYQLFYDSSLVDFEEYAELEQAGSRCFEVMLEQIRRGKSEGVFEPRPDEELAAILWSGLHGVASLVRMHRHHEVQEEQPVLRAVSYLAVNRKDAITRMLSSILASNLHGGDSNFYCE